MDDVPWLDEIVDGLAASPRQERPLTDETRAELAARVINALQAKPDLANRLSQIDVSDLHNAEVILTGEQAAIEARLRDDPPHAIAAVNRSF